jgi:hypothetical protein
LQAAPYRLIFLHAFHFQPDGSKDPGQPFRVDLYRQIITKPIITDGHDNVPLGLKWCNPAKIVFYNKQSAGPDGANFHGSAGAILARRG